MDDFWQRLKQRKLVQWALAWTAFAFALLQGIDIVASRFAWPPSIERYLILALIVGFFVVLVLAWYHGEKGAQRVGGMEIIILAVLLAIGGGLIWCFGAMAKAPQTETMARTAASAPAASAQPVSTSTPHTSLAAVAEDIPQKSVAVLPFTNESGKADEQFFSDGLSEDLINALSQFDGLKVISRNSAFQFRNSKDSSAKIGALLGVAHLLEGSVQRQGDEVRITATLVNAADGSTLWSTHYDKPYKDLFALQDAITAAVADALKAKLLTAPGAVVQSDRPPSGNLDAYTAYQHGLSYYALNTEAGFQQAIAAFNDAIRLDSQYAAAYAQLSMAWDQIDAGFLSDPAQVAHGWTTAHTAAATALRLNPDLALAHEARGNLLLNAAFDWSGAEAEYRRALQLAPNDALAQFNVGFMQAVLGQVRSAATLTRKVLAADPRNSRLYEYMSKYLAALRQEDAARQAIDTAIALQPGAAGYHNQLAFNEILRGDAKAALAAAEQEPPGPWREIALALTLQIGPDNAAADAALKALIARQATAAPYQIAEVYALRRDPDAMFQWLGRAWTHRDPGIAYLLNDSLILRYRNDPRFAAFCKKVGLPTTTDAVAMK